MSKEKRLPLTAEQVLAITSSYSAGSKTQQELAAEYGITTTAINKVVQDAPKPAKRKYTSVKNVERDQTILRLYGEIKSTREIASIVGCTHQNISLVLKKHGVDPSANRATRSTAKSTAVTAELMAARTARAEARQKKIDLLSQLWISGATGQQICEGTGLKSVAAVNVKVVMLRKVYPDKFPYRRQNKPEVAE